MDTNSKFLSLDFKELENVNGGADPSKILKVIEVIGLVEIAYNFGAGVIDGYKDAAASRRG